MKNKNWNEPPNNELQDDKEYQARIITDIGEMLFVLFSDKAPLTVNNFVFLARQGFYDDTIFHRVINNFMAQGGDPTGTGTGGPGYRFKDEFHPSLKHNKLGILSMANAGPNTNGSQFFITHLATPWLDNKHTVFGNLIEGEDVLLAIPERDPRDLTAPSVKISTIEIIEK
jgi:cyclophilin family peptidyl-prolyl cis-trans isomerase